MRIHSFVRSIHKAEAGDAPIETLGLMGQMVPASPCHPLEIHSLKNEVYAARSRQYKSFIICCSSSIFSFYIMCVRFLIVSRTRRQSIASYEADSLGGLYILM